MRVDDDNASVDGSDRTEPDTAEPPRVGLAGIRAVMVFSRDPEASCRWWAGVLDRPMHAEEGGFCWVEATPGLELGFHPADQVKNPTGASTVPYWKVDDVGVALAALEAAGARLHRGPLRIDATRRIAQVLDPFDVVMGIDGP